MCVVCVCGRGEGRSVCVCVVGGGGGEKTKKETLKSEEKISTIGSGSITIRLAW